MQTDIHPKGPQKALKAAKNQIKPIICGQQLPTHIENIDFNIYFSSLKNFKPTKSDPRPARGRIFFDEK